jgi:hypothetical protein
MMIGAIKQRNAHRRAFERLCAGQAAEACADDDDMG